MSLFQPLLDPNKDVAVLPRGRLEIMQCDPSYSHLVSGVEVDMRPVHFPELSIPWFLNFDTVPVRSTMENNTEVLVGFQSNLFEVGDFLRDIETMSLGCTDENGRNIAAPFWIHDHMKTFLPVCANNTKYE